MENYIKQILNFRPWGNADTFNKQSRTFYKCNPPAYLNEKSDTNDIYKSFPIFTI
jgi:hypothetical protein